MSWLISNSLRVQRGAMWKGYAVLCRRHTQSALGTNVQT